MSDKRTESNTGSPGEPCAAAPGRADAADHDAGRRRFLKGTAAGTAAAAGIAAVAPAVASGARHRPTFSAAPDVYAVRMRAASGYLDAASPRHQDNGDESTFRDRRACFFKTLPQNDLGEVDRGAYQRLLRATRSGRPEHFEAIPQSPQSVRALANPQAAFAAEMTGTAAPDTVIGPAPGFTSALQAAEMGELYWQALTRDVPFRDYESHPDILAATIDLNGFAEPAGPVEGGAITPATLFRGETDGDLVGPYISQFLWRSAPFGHATLNAPAAFPVAGDDFCVDYAEWLAVQRGAVPAHAITPDGTPRYIYNNRCLGDFVHTDVSFQAYMTAALCALEMGPEALDDGNPYLASSNQQGFVTFGAPDILGLIATAARVALTGAWFQKWRVHRRLRPEVFGGRIENQGAGVKHYGIHADIMSCDALGRTLAAHGTRLLPQAYPEGSPTHPSYPAGHACIAGACATILKAFFNEDFVIPAPVQASADGLTLDPWDGDDLTLGSEFDKLASNIAIGRNAAGVHYRSDGVDGIDVGEQQAIGILKDYSLTYAEHFDGFRFTRFDGTPVTIVNGRLDDGRRPRRRRRARWGRRRRPVREHP